MPFYILNFWKSKTSARVKIIEVYLELVLSNIAKYLSWTFYRTCVSLFDHWWWSIIFDIWYSYLNVVTCDIFYKSDADSIGHTKRNKKIIWVVCVIITYLSLKGNIISFVNECIWSIKKQRPHLSSFRLC